MSDESVLSTIVTDLSFYTISWWVYTSIPYSYFGFIYQRLYVTFVLTWLKLVPYWLKQSFVPKKITQITCILKQDAKKIGTIYSEEWNDGLKVPVICHTLCVCVFVCVCVCKNV